MKYDSDYFRWVREHHGSAAQVVAALMLELVRPASVIDVGCGDGTWLAAFAAKGVQEVRGLDGPWIAPEDLHIPAHQFSIVDLTSDLPAQGSKFDLAMSLEVAEHLPGERADALVGWLTTLAPVVLFSAAIPGQGGRDHVNEQWPAYWAELFRRHGFVASDCIRPLIWNRDEIPFWYRQNMLVFVDAGRLEHYPGLAAQLVPEGEAPLPLVHPEQFTLVHDAFVRAQQASWSRAAVPPSGRLRRRLVAWFPWLRAWRRRPPDAG